MANGNLSLFFQLLNLKSEYANEKSFYGPVALYVLYGLVSRSFQGINVTCNFTCPEMGRRNQVAQGAPKTSCSKPQHCMKEACLSHFNVWTSSPRVSPKSSTDSCGNKRRIEVKCNSVVRRCAFLVLLPRDKLQPINPFGELNRMAFFKR